MSENLPNILALDTSTRNTVIALCVNGSMYSVQKEGKSHSQHVLQLIDELLLSARISLNDLDCLATTRGPGSFTGLRIGIAVTQGLAFGLELPVVELSSLSALLHSALLSDKALSTTDYVLATMDARMGELYGCWYSLERSEIESMGCEFVCAPESLGKFTPTLIDASVKDCSVDGEVCTRVAMLGTGLNYAKQMAIGYARVADTLGVVDACISAEGLLDLALREYQSGNYKSALELEPIYVRDNVTHVAS